MNKIKNLNKKETILTRATELMSQYRRGDKLIKRWRDNSNLYDSVFDTPDKPISDVLVGQGKLFIPKTYSHTQRILVDILEEFCGDEEEFVYIKNWKTIPSETRDIVKALLSYRLCGHPINYYEEVLEAVLDALKYKIGVFKVYPELKYNEAEDSEEPIEFRPVIECIPFEDVFFHPKATWKTYWKYPIIHRMRKTIDYLKRRGYKNINKLVSMREEALFDETEEHRRQDEDTLASMFSSTTEERVNEVVIYEFWDFLDVNNDGLLESCSYVCAGDSNGVQVVIRGVEENVLPYRFGGDFVRPPIIVGSAYPEPHKMYGKSLPEIVEGLQREVNSQRNQRREGTALAMRKPTLVSRSAGMDLVSLVNRRIGGVVLADDISKESVREMDVSEPPQSSIIEMNQNANDFYETTSIAPNLLGMPTNSQETATGVQAHVMNANKKIQQVITNIRVTLIVPALSMLLRLEQMYETDEFINLVTGRVLGWQQGDDNVPPTDLIQGDFELTAGAGINKNMQLNKLMLIMDRGNMSNQVMLALLQSNLIKQEEVKLFDSSKALQRAMRLLGESNVEEFFVNPQQPQQQETPEGGGGGEKGIASQTYMNMNPDKSLQFLEEM